MRNRVIICEASEIIVEGLSEIINALPDFDVVMHAETPERLDERILSSDANILIINPILLGLSEKNLPLKLSKEHSQLFIIALVTSYLDPSVQKPYNTFIEINDSKQKIAAKLNEIAKSDDKSEMNDDVELSRRETDVLIAVAKGLMNKEIAELLNISIHTVITHRKNISKKTGIKSVSGLTVYALLNNLIDETEVYK